MEAGGSFGCSVCEIWSSVSGKEETGQEARLQLRTSGELTLASPGMVLEESHRNRHCKEKGFERAG